MVKKRIIHTNSRKQIVKENPPISLRDFYDRRNKILIVRAVGGLGDILMHRMIFEDFKKIDPEIKIVFSTLPCYFDALKDHPFIDDLVHSEHVDFSKYNISYNTTNACNRYEVAMAPHSGLHRSDIWANHCGVQLKNHNMHLTISPEALNYGMQTINHYRLNNKPIVLLCPVSAMVIKNLLENQIKSLVEELRKSNCFVLASHHSPISVLADLDVPIIRTDVQQLFGLVNACDYIISVDTAQFHIAGGLGKPVVGIFTFADGKVYSRYYNAEIVQKHRDNGDWDCGPCYNWPNCPKSSSLPKPCVTEITTEMIMSGFRKIKKNYPWKPTILK